MNGIALRGSNGSISLLLTGAPGRYRLGLWDTRLLCVVAVVKGEPRQMEVGDRWIVRANVEHHLVVIVPTTVDQSDPNRHAWCLVSEEAVRL